MAKTVHARLLSSSANLPAEKSRTRTKDEHEKKEQQ